MSTRKTQITLTFSLEQVCNDILAKCNLISKGMKDEAMADIRADIASPDSDETRSIICRAVTEAFGNLKIAAQRWLTTGRTTDNNNLERLVASVTYVQEGGQDTDEVDTITYENVVLSMAIPNFNTAVTDGMKSHMHKYVVNYVMGRFLQDQYADKAAEYTKEAAETDYPQIVSDLNAREEFGKRKPTFY